MRWFRARHVLVTVLAIVSGRALAEGEHEHAHDVPEKFGQVHFPTSCKPETQAAFERGVALLHSFAYVKSAATFQEVSATDPACGMAQWGVAATYFHTIWGPPTDDEFAAGRATAQKAAQLGAPTARAQDYIGAIGAYYQGDGVPHPLRVVAYEKAMTGVQERNPDDHEAAIFHALAMLGVAYNSPPDKTYARQREAAKILNRLLKVEPEQGLRSAPDPLAWTQKEARAAAAEKRAEAKAKGYEGEACGECGNFTLVRNGTCMKCDTCGSTTGCS